MKKRNCKPKKARKKPVPKKRQAAVKASEYENRILDALGDLDVLGMRLRELAREHGDSRSHEVALCYTWLADQIGDVQEVLRGEGE
jgi:hypothetical protein